MNLAKNNFHEDQSIGTCPVSGLPILQKPEWRNAVQTDNYKISICLLGNNILYLQPHGYATLEETKQVLMLLSDVLAHGNNRQQPYAQVENYSQLAGASLEARRYYIDYLKKQKRLLGLVFVNTSPIMKLSIKLARRLNRIHFNVKTAESYGSAVRTAQTLLAEPRIAMGEDYALDASKLSSRSPVDASAQRVIHHPDWHLQLADFSLRFEVINDKILHGITTGRLEKHR